jgi:hypothetical protein
MMPTFHEVFLGKAEKLRLAIVVAATRAQREDLNVAIWDLPRADLLRIMADIAERDNATTARQAARTGITPQLITPEDAAIRCDEVGIENRFFRLNGMVANWIDQTAPVEAIDYMVL